MAPGKREWPKLHSGRYWLCDTRSVAHLFWASVCLSIKRRWMKTNPYETPCQEPSPVLHSFCHWLLQFSQEACKVGTIITPFYRGRDWGSERLCQDSYPAGRLLTLGHGIKLARMSNAIKRHNRGVSAFETVKHQANISGDCHCSNSSKTLCPVLRPKFSPEGTIIGF